MPEISRFFGIIIYMNWCEHPPMHFHAVYGDFEALITLDGKVCRRLAATCAVNGARMARSASRRVGGRLGAGADEEAAETY
jgi:hypothetical protein